MKKIVYFILTLFILTSCSKTGDNVKENKKMQTEEKVMNPLPLLQNPLGYQQNI